MRPSCNQPYRSMENLLIPYQAVRHPGSGAALVLAPHPDDEVFGCGGAIMRHLDAGEAVQVIIVTGGGFSGEGKAGDQAAYVHTRQEESRQAAHVLGYGEPVFWGLADRGIEYGEKLVRQILAAIDASGAPRVYAPSVLEMHPDHRALGMAAAEAVRRSDVAHQLMMYEVGAPLRPNLLLDITDLMERKQAAMACFVSQLAVQEYDQHITALNRYRAYTLPMHIKYAEAYWQVDAGALRANPLGLYDSEFRRQRQQGLTTDAGTLPLVSIIIRSMGRQTLTEALDSVALQTWPNIEVVVVDALGEGHPAIGEWCGRFPMRLVGTGHPLGRSQAANLGLDQARGHYINFLDDDDLLDPDHVAGLVAVLETQPAGRVAYAGVRCTYADLDCRNEEHILSEEFNAARLLGGNYIPIHAVLLERALAVEGCRFDEELEVCEDWDFWIQVSSRTAFIHLPTVSATYRCSGTSGVGPGPDLVDDAKVSAAREKIFEKWKAVWRGADINAIIAERERTARRGKPS